MKGQRTNMDSARNGIAIQGRKYNAMLQHNKLNIHVYYMLEARERINLYKKFNRKLHS